MRVMSKHQEFVYRSSNWRGANKQKVHKSKDCFHLQDVESVSEHPVDSMPGWAERCDYCWSEGECEECGSKKITRIHPFLTYCRDCEEKFNPNPRWEENNEEPFNDE